MLTCEENMKRTEVSHALLLLQCSSNVEHNHEQEAQLTESGQRSTIDAEVWTCQQAIYMLLRWITII